MKIVACFKDKKFLDKEELEENEYKVLSNTLEPLNKLIRELNFINDLKLCFKELNSIINSYISGKIIFQVLQKDINRLILNYLSSIRAFLDNWEKYIKENFGKTSNELEIFENLTSQEYDNNFYYRFVYKLRNFAQHTSYSYHNITTSLNGDKKIIEIFIDKKLFLKDFDWKKEFYDEINSLPEDEIKIYPLLNIMFKSLNKIHYDLIKFNIVKDINNLLKNSLFLINFLNKYKDCDGEILIIEYINDLEEIKNANEIEMIIEHLPLKIALQIIKSYLKTNKKNIKLFEFSGLYFGKANNLFPYEKNGGFFEGSEIVEYKNLKWIRVISELKCNTDTINLTAIYIIGELNPTYYKAILKVVKTLKESKYNNLLDYLKE